VGSSGGSTNDDGSHPTGAGAAFIASMRRKGLVEPERGSRFDEGPSDDW
jgi:hypothetical protein